MSAPQVVVADHPGAFRSGVSSYLAEDTRYDVVEVDDADGLVAAGRAGTADVILIDSGMAQSAELQNALAAVGASMSSAIVWGFGVDGDEVVAALRAGANGYLDKEISPTGLRRAIDAALRGEAVLPRSIMRSILDQLQSWEERAQAREMIATLSPRERQVLALIGSGSQNRAIAASLHISEHTLLMFGADHRAHVHTGFHAVAHFHDAGGFDKLPAGGTRALAQGVRLYPRAGTTQSH